jgi:hypothetical protein
MQTKFGSFVEAWGNVAIGFVINFTANWLILPRFGFTDLTLTKNFEIGLAFTVISVVRSYAIRRWFNNLKWGNSAEKLELGEEEGKRVSVEIRGDGSGVANEQGDRISIRDDYIKVYEENCTGGVQSVWRKVGGSDRDVHTRFHPGERIDNRSEGTTNAAG